jgi:L-ribulokinase
MAEHGTVVERIINGGGIPQKNAALNQIYANVLNKPILVPQGDVTSLGSAIFAFMAAKAFPSIEAAQNTLCPPFRMFVPDKESVMVYEELFRLYKRLYFALGMRKSEAVTMGDLLPQLRRIAEKARKAK